MPLHLKRSPANPANQDVNSLRSIALFIPAKPYRNLVVLTALALACLTSPGGLQATTAPTREEQREKVEASLKHLAEISPDKIARFLDQRMGTALALTDKQLSRVIAINLDYAQQLHAIAISTDKVRVKARALSKENDDHQTALKEVITAGQFAKFLTMKEEMRDALKDLHAEK